MTTLARASARTGRAMSACSGLPGLAAGLLLLAFALLSFPAQAATDPVRRAPVQVAAG
jgi:hypothetical protein